MDAGLGDIDPFDDPLWAVADLEDPLGAILKPLDRPVQLLRLRGFFDRRAEPSTLDAFERALETLKKAGAEVIDLSDEEFDFEHILVEHRRIMSAQCAAFHESRFAEHSDEYSPHIRGLVEEGLASSVTGYIRARFAQDKAHSQLRHVFDGDFSAIVTPATIGPAPDASTTGNPCFNSPWSYLGWPAVSFPIGLDPDGLPLAIQLVGSPNDVFQKYLLDHRQLVRSRHPTRLPQRERMTHAHQRPDQRSLLKPALPRRPGAHRHARRTRQNRAEPDLVARARESLEETLAGLKLTPEEERAMADELRQLRDLGQKLDENTIEIAAFGMVSRGKSSVLNALLGKDVFKTGTTHGTTVVRIAQRWEQVTAERPGLEGAKLILVDTPGIDEVGGEVREALARDVARHADLILFVVSSDMQRVEIEALSQLREAQKPIILVFNQIDRYPDADRDQIYAKIKDERVRDLIRPDDVVMTAARPDPFKVKIQLPDGTTTIQWERPAPVIEPLKVRILDVLEREGKALVALNTLLHRGRPARGDRRAQAPDPRRRRQPADLELRARQGGGRRPQPDPRGRHGRRPGGRRRHDRRPEQGLRHPAHARRRPSGLVRDMMVALGALGVVEVATRLVASGVQVVAGGL